MKESKIHTPCSLNYFKPQEIHFDDFFQIIFQVIGTHLFCTISLECHSFSFDSPGMWDKKLTSFYSVIIIALLLLSPDFLITNFCFGVFFIQSHFFFACSSLFLFFLIKFLCSYLCKTCICFWQKGFLRKVHF